MCVLRLCVRKYSYGICVYVLQETFSVGHSLRALWNFETAFIHVRMFALIDVCMHACMHVCARMLVRMHMYVYVSMHSVCILGSSGFLRQSRPSHTIASSHTNKTWSCAGEAEYGDVECVLRKHRKVFGLQLLLARRPRDVRPQLQVP